MKNLSCIKVAILQAAKEQNYCYINQIQLIS